MTLTSTTVCHIIQSFPILLILVQNTRKCLHTPLIYKPPSPTYTPEYYEAYDTLITNLLQDHSCHEYQYGVPHVYGKKYSVARKLCYNLQPSPSYGHDLDQSLYAYAFPNFEASNPSYNSHGIYATKNDFNSTYAYNYAPNVKRVKRKYKIVVKNGKHTRRQKFEKLNAGK